MKANALFISLDRNLFAQKMTDVVERHREYAKYFTKIVSLVYTLSKDKYKPKKLAKNVRVIPSNSLSPWTFVWSVVRKGKKLIKEENIDLIATQDPFATGLAGYFLKRSTGAKLVINVFSGFFDDPYWLSEDWKNRFLHSIGKFVVRRADGVRVECDTEKRKLVELGVAANKVTVAPVPVQLKSFARAKPIYRKKLLHKTYDRIVLFAGRLSIEKDVGTLLHAAEIIQLRRPETRFVIIGSGKEEETLKALAQKLGLWNTVFLGRKPHTDLPKYMRSSDVFVLPSVYEGIPLVSVEAAGAGLPVVSTAVRDAPDVMIDGKTGFIVPQKDHQAMAERLLLILKDPKRAQEMGKAGQKFVTKKFDPKANLRALVSLWEKVVKRK